MKTKRFPSPPFAPIKWTGGSFEAAMHAAAELRREQEKREAEVKRIADSWQRAEGSANGFTGLLSELSEYAPYLFRSDVELLAREILRAIEHGAIEEGSTQ